MTLTASCHCGATKIELPHSPETANECNCTFCSRTGAIWAYYQPGELKVTSDTADRFYSASGAGNEHHFCGNCGMQTWGVSPDWGSVYNSDGTPKGEAGAMPTSQIFSVNLRLIEDFDWSKVSVDKVDGRNSW